MEHVTHVIATFHEICLKKGNRGFFERTLKQNVRTALAGLPPVEISVPARLVLRFSEPAPWPEVHARLATVFGINNIIPVVRVGTTYDELAAYVTTQLDKLGQGSFAVTCQRSDKRFHLTSIQVCQQLGELVHMATGLRANLRHPDITLGVIIQHDGIYFYRERFPGPGGLPVGTSGKVLVLLSGGIDSPVAAYMVMKRGVRVSFVHFHSGPYAPESSLRKVEELAADLNRHQGQSRLAVVPFGECQQAIVANCPEKLRVVLYRRMMIRAAERIARRWRCQALVTGESLNQVASQTLQNMTTIDRVTHMPILRPLIGMDKDEIIHIAERIGTYETSILPHHDCCSYLQPLHPATRSTAAECDKAEENLDVDEWTHRLQHETERRLVQPRPWQVGKQDR